MKFISDRTNGPVAVFAIVALSLLTTGTANAGNNQKLRAGLWEIKLEGSQKSASDEYVSTLEKKMDGLPDFLRQRLNKMIGWHKKIVGEQNKFCITKAQFSKSPVSAMGPEGCTEKVVWDSMSGDGKVFLNCPDGSKGRGQMNIVKPTQFGLLLQMSGGAAKKGRQVYTGNFVSSDCGNIAPRQ